METFAENMLCKVKLFVNSIFRYSRKHYGFHLHLIVLLFHDLVHCSFWGLSPELRSLGAGLSE